MDIVCNFFAYCLLYLFAQCFQGFGYFMVLDIIYIFIILGPPGRASIGTCLECLCVNPSLGGAEDHQGSSEQVEHHHRGASGP